MVNMGGGFPASYITPTCSLQEYANKINEYLLDCFDKDLPEIILEPGRSLVGNAGILVSEIVTVAKKSISDNYRWVFLDAGKFNGLAETIDECIKYPVVVDCKADDPVGEVILAGPTCDSMDIMYEKHRYTLPININSGQRLYWLSTGAYTSSYASVEFNGFPPIKNYFIND